jgi:hypothetical protein
VAGFSSFEATESKSDEAIARFTAHDTLHERTRRLGVDRKKLGDN